VDENGDIIAKLTDGTLQKCAGNEIDDDGDVVDGKGTTVGHVTLLEDIPEPEPEPEAPKESEEEIAERKQLEQDKKLAGQLAQCIDQSLENIKPILKMITDVSNHQEGIYIYKTQLTLYRQLIRLMRNPRRSWMSRSLSTLSSH